MHTRIIIIWEKNHLTQNSSKDKVKKKELLWPVPSTYLPTSDSEKAWEESKKK